MTILGTMPRYSPPRPSVARILVSASATPLYCTVEFSAVCDSPASAAHVSHYRPKQNLVSASAAPRYRTVELGAVRSAHIGRSTSMVRVSSRRSCHVSAPRSAPVCSGRCSPKRVWSSSAVVSARRRSIRSRRPPDDPLMTP
eukprot:837411-Prorocentrum_minimum.AAC.1